MVSVGKSGASQVKASPQQPFGCLATSLIRLIPLLLAVDVSRGLEDCDSAREFWF